MGLHRRRRLARAVGAVVHAADKGSNNPVLSAVRVRGSDGSIELSATNRYVAATARADGSADMDALVPAAWLKANAEGADRIGATGRMFAIAGPVYTDATPMVEGQAPALAAIWPSKDAPLTLTMDRAELLEAARRVKAVKFSGGETVTLALAVGDDSVTLGLDDAESGSAPARPSPPRCPAPWSTGMWRARAAACAWTRATSPTPAAPSTATV